MLRDYQTKAIEEIRRLFSSGTKRVLLQAPTGSGKTVVFCHILKSAFEKKFHAIMVVSGKELVHQASRRLDREGVDHGVIMSDHWRKQPNQHVQVCSIHTLFIRKTIPKAKMIIIDEAHQATSQSYHWLIAQYPDAFILAVTATPFVRKSLRHIASEIVRPVTIKELVDQRFLVPPKYYAPSIPDLTGIRTTAADFNTDDLDKILNKSHPIGDVIKSWRSLAENRSTVLFAVTINHSLSIVSAFNAAGIPAEHLESDSKDSERQAAIRRLESGEIKILSNVGILCTGVDIPSLGCVVSVRPTKSYALYIQQLGRGTRSYPGKENFIVIDHGGNVLRHGCILEERHGSLDPIPKGKKRSAENDMYTCQCYAVFHRSVKFCPACGELNPTAPSVAKDEKAKNPIDASLEKADPFHIKVIARRGELRDTAKRRGYKNGWVFFKLKEEFGEDVANKYAPRRKIPDHIRDKLRNLPKQWTATQNTKN